MRKFIIIFIAIGIALFLAAAVGLFEIPDAFFYYTLGQYLYTGQIFRVYPFNAFTPQTLFSPVYALIVYPIVSKLPISVLFVLPFLQLSMVFLSGYFLSRIVKRLFPHKNGGLAVLLFFLLPFNIVYAFVFMSEITTMFFVSVYTYLFITLKHSPWRNTLLVFSASVLVLTRYAFLPLLGITLLLFLYKRPKKIIQYIPAIIGLSFIAAWVVFHIHWYHTPQLSMFTGRHIYDNVITTGKFIPKNRKDPLVAKFFTYVPDGDAMIKPWWDAELYFIAPFQEGKVTEMDIDRMFLAVSIQGIKENLQQYILHLFKLAIVTPNTPPYHDNILSQIGFTETGCSTCGLRECRFSWITSSQCKPILTLPIATTIFGYFLLGNKALFPIITSALFILAIIGGIGSVIERNKPLVFLATIFFMQHMFQSATEWIEGRFMLPLYPIYAILIFQGVTTVIKLKKFITVIKNRNV